MRLFIYIYRALLYEYIWIVGGTLLWIYWALLQIFMSLLKICEYRTLAFDLHV